MDSDYAVKMKFLQEMKKLAATGHIPYPKSQEWPPVVPKETWHLPFDVTLQNVHAEGTCAGDSCLFHNPSEHHMSMWTLSYEASGSPEKVSFYRVCEHLASHPDPDAVLYLIKVLGYKNAGFCECGCHCCYEDDDDDDSLDSNFP